MRSLAVFLVLAAVPAWANPERMAIVAVGDSLTNGYAFTTKPMPEWVEELVGVPVDNMGIGSDVAANMRTRWQQYASPYLYAVLIMEGCTNDLAAGTSAAACWATLQAWLADAKAAGQRVVICTVFPRGGSSGWTADMETQRQLLNAFIRTEAATNINVRLFDGDVVLSDDGVNLKPSFNYGDHLHLNPLGHETFGRAMALLVR